MKPMKARDRFALAGSLTAAFCAITFSASALAADYTWQTAGDSNTWSTNASDTNWFIDEGTTLSPWTDGKHALFPASPGEVITLSGTVAPLSTTVSNDGNWSFTGAGILGGSGALWKNGGGTLTLSNSVANTYSGGTAINGGILSLGTGGTGADTSTVGALGSGTVTINAPGTLRLWIRNNAGFTITNPLAVDGGTILNEDGNHTLSGNMTIGAAGLKLQSKYDTKNFTLSGVLSGGGGITVSSANHATTAVILTNNNSYAGGTQVNSGELRASVGTTAGTFTRFGSGPVTVNSGATLRLFAGSTANEITYNNPLNLNSATLFYQDGTHVLTGNATLTGGTAIRGYWGNKNLRMTGVISGTGSLTKNDRDAGQLTTLVLTNSNTYSGGTTVALGTLQLGNNVATDKGGTGVIRGTVTVNSGATLNLSFTNALGYAAGQKVEVVNINGGTLTHAANGDNGWGVTYNMTGGTLQTTGTGNFSFGGNTSLNTLASPGSAVVNGLVRLRESNIDNNVNFTVADGAAPLDLVVNANINQSAAGFSFTKLGAGVMQINGAASHSGATNANEGILLLGATGTLSGSPVQVGSGGYFATAVAGKSLASVAAANGATLGLPAAVGMTTTVLGAINLADAGTIKIAPLLGAATIPGAYDLATAGAITGSGGVAFSSATPFGPSRAAGSVAITGNKIRLNLTSVGDSLIWNNAGGGGSDTGFWDTNNSANWNNNGSNGVFLAYDSVTFDDTVAPGMAKTVNVSGVVAPATITANNSAGNDYTLNATTAGGGSVAGSPSLVKANAGTLTLGANLVYGAVGGDITVSGGTLNLGGKTLGNHANLTVTGGTLSNGTLPVTGAINLQAGTVGATLTGATAVSKTTAGTMILGANNNLTGSTSVAAGTLQIGTGGNTGSLGSGSVAISPGATLAFNRNDSALTIANPLSGTGALILTGTNNGDAGAGTGNGQSSYPLGGNNSGFNGPITVTNARVILDNANDAGTATITTGVNGGVYVTAGTYANAIVLAGTGWGEATGMLGALRLQGGTLTGPVTLAGHTRITTHSGAGTIAGPIGESGGPRNLEIGGSGTATNFNTVLTLSGASIYTGTTSIGTAAGRTATVNLTGSLGHTAVTVNTGSTLNGNGSIGGSLTFASGATTLGVNLGLPGALTVAGAVAFNDTVTVNLTPAAVVVPGGAITLMNYGSASGAASNFVLANAANYRQAVFALGTNALTLDIGAAALTWTGAGGLAWDIGSTANWNTQAPVAASAFYQGDTVTFDDSAGAANASVSCAAALTPAAIAISNSAAVPFAFSGAGSVGGAASLVKTGNGTVTVQVAMPYTGGTTITNGTFIVDAAQEANRQAVNGAVTVTGAGVFEIRGVNALPTGANSVNPTLDNGGTLSIVSGASTGFPAGTGSHAHINNLTLNGGLVEFTHSGAGTAYNNESVQINGTLTVVGSAPSTIDSAVDPTLQGLALIGNRTFVVADVTTSPAPDLTITAEVENSDANNGALTKTGSGTLRLMAANSYSAGTTVTAGTLLADNGATGSATGSGSVTVAAGAVLGGNGGATGTVAAAGTISPGSNASAFGVLRLGATTLTGTYACDIDQTAFDTIAVTGDLTLTGATLSLNVGTANAPSYTIATWTGTRTGAFQVTGKPVDYQVVYDDSAREIRLELPTGTAYDAYELANNIVGAGPDADSDGDGIANGLEFVLGGVSDPALKVNSAALLPEIEDLGAGIRFSFHLTADAASMTPKIWNVEFDDDLVAPWTTAVDPGNAAITITPDGVSPESGVAWSKVTVTIPKAGARRFVRLNVTLP